MVSGRMDKRLRLRVSPAAELKIRKGHPWVFRDSLREHNRPGDTGDLAVIFDKTDRFLAVGLYDAESPIAIRVLHTGTPKMVDKAFFRQRLIAATQLRNQFDELHTNGYRIVNGESDGFPGLILDQYAGTLVLKIYTGAWLTLWPVILEVILSEFSKKNLVIRFSRNAARIWEAKWNLRDGQVLQGTLSNPKVPFLENGIEFQADVVNGQKTGFFLDQRENRLRISTYTKGQKVLNLFCYTGGFSLFADRGGAVEVTSVDISEHALQGLRENLLQNRARKVLGECSHIMVKADAFFWIESQKERKFDVVVVDPPSLAKREAERLGAIRAYGRLIENALRLVSPGGLLVAASCSAHVSADEFFNAASRVTTCIGGRGAKEIGRFRHASDHHATFPEGEYLKSIYFRIH